MAPLIEGFHPGYERKGIFSTEDVFKELGNSWAVFDGDVMPVISLRYKVFARSCACVDCGIVGTYFAKERSAKRMRDKIVVQKINGERVVTVTPPEVRFKATSLTWHFNLYAMHTDGREILMTKDHVLPKSKGGLDFLGNLQTMCQPCNGQKANFHPHQPSFIFEGDNISL